MARRRGPFVDLGLPVTPRHAHILAQAVDMTGFATENRCWDCAGGGAQSVRRSESVDATAHPGCLRWVSIRCMHACWHGKFTCPIFDCRETVMGLCRLPRTVCESIGQRWRDGAGSLPILGYPVTKMLAHTLAWAGDAADFRLSRNGDGTVRAAAHSLRACGGAMARRRGQFGDLGYPVTKMLAHTLARGGRCGRFSTVEKRRWDCAGCQAQSASVWGSDGATARAVLRPRVSGH